MLGSRNPLDQWLAMGLVAHSNFVTDKNKGTIELFNWENHESILALPATMVTLECCGMYEEKEVVQWMASHT